MKSRFEVESRTTSRSLGFGRWPFLLVLGFLAVPFAAAHDLWIAPPAGQTGLLGLDEALAIHLHVGHGQRVEDFARHPRHLKQFLAHGPGETQPVPGLDGKTPAGWLRAEVPGLWTLSYESRGAHSHLSAARFQRHLEEEGLDHILALRRERGEDGQAGREFYVRSLKSLLRIGTEEWGAGDRPVGLPLEIVVEKGLDLFGDRTLGFRLLLTGQPLAGTLVEARQLDGELRVQSRTGPEGRVDLEMGSGSWVVSAVHMVESQRPDADWESLFATLTFILP